MARILVVDDDPDLAAVCSLVLLTEGYDTDIARNGMDAVKALTVDKADVVLLDVMMPLLDGLTVCRMVKRDPRTSKVPVIIMSASEVMRKEAIDAHADAVLEKPFDIDLLLDTVGRFASPHA